MSGPNVLTASSTSIAENGTPQARAKRLVYRSLIASGMHSQILHPRCRWWRVLSLITTTCLTRFD